MEILIKVRRKQVDITQCFSSSPFFGFFFFFFFGSEILERSKAAAMEKEMEVSRGMGGQGGAGSRFWASPTPTFLRPSLPLSVETFPC